MKYINRSSSLFVRACNTLMVPGKYYAIDLNSNYAYHILSINDNVSALSAYKQSGLITKNIYVLSGFSHLIVKEITKEQFYNFTW